MNAITPFTPQSPALDSPELRARVERFVNASRAHNTRRAYAGAWAEFEQFCRERGYPALPTPPQAVIDYVTALAEAGQKAATIQVKLAAIGFVHESAEFANPAKSPQVRTTMSGIRRTIGTAQRRKAPATLDVLQQVVTALPDDLRGKRDKALLLLGYAGAFRRSELVALDVEDVRFGNPGAIVTVRRSKTDQEGRGMVKVVPRLNNPMCPVAALRDWLNAAGIQSGAIWRAIDRWGHVHNRRMTDREVARILKRAAERAGIDARQFAGHSLRAGLITQAASAGVPEWQIQEVTGHKSAQVLRRYIRDAGRGQMDAIRAAFGAS